MFTRSDNKKDGFTLLVLLIAVFIIAAIFSGFYLAKNDNNISTPTGQIKALKNAETDIDKINQITEGRKQTAEEVGN